MRPSAVRELDRRIDILKTSTSPYDIPTGMSGSYIRFCMWLDPLNVSADFENRECLTEDEWNDAVYDDYLMKRHREIFEEVNGEELEG